MLNTKINEKQTEFNLAMDELLREGELDEYKIFAEGSYSGASIVSRYILPTRVMEKLSEQGFSNMYVHELDGKHSETESTLQRKKISQIYKYGKEISFGYFEVNKEDYEDGSYDDYLEDYSNDVIQDYEDTINSNIEDGFDSEGYEVEESDLKPVDNFILGLLSKGVYRNMLLNYLRYHIETKQVEVPEEYIEYVKYGNVEEVARRLYLAEKV